jgi:DNA-directed RNA polymerase
MGTYRKGNPKVKIGAVMELCERQDLLEHGSIHDGAEKYRKMLEDKCYGKKGNRIGIVKVRDTGLSDTGVGALMMRNSFEVLHEALVRFMKSRRNVKIDADGSMSDGGTCGKLQEVSDILYKFHLTTHELAYLSLKAAVNILGGTQNGGRVRMSAACISVAEMVLDQNHYTNFRYTQPDYLKDLSDELETSSLRRKKFVILRAAKKKLTDEDGMSAPDKVALGQKLLDLVIVATGLLKIYQDRSDRTTNTSYLVASEEAINWIKNINATAKLLHPILLPMIMQPIPWKSFSGGGYRTEQLMNRRKLLKTSNKAALARFAEGDISKVTEAVNHIQNTAWRINGQVYGVASKILELNGMLAGLCREFKEDTPVKQWEPVPKEQWKDFKADNLEMVVNYVKAKRKWFEKKHSAEGKITQDRLKLSIAERFLDEPAIYFPHAMDFRGRCYPIPTCNGMNPQGDDLGKALLEFAEGKPLGQRGAYWLMVHLANTYGEDKMSFDNRIQWVKDNEAAILDSAENPLDGGRFWCAIDNKGKLIADKPFCFLAACFEYKGYKEHGESFISYLPIAMDGTCNG